MKPAKPIETGVAKAVENLLPEIRTLIEEARHRAVTAANLSMVALYWNVGRVINTELQKAPGRADYGSQLVERLAVRLGREYARGFSAPNLWDMKRFHATFKILQPVARESEILSPAAGESAPVIRQPLAAESAARLEIDLTRHFHLGWTHYRIPLGIGDARQRRFYFEHACRERWSKRELQRQIAGALFERVALTQPPCADKMPAHPFCSFRRQDARPALRSRLLHLRPQLSTKRQPTTENTEHTE